MSVIASQLQCQIRNFRRADDGNIAAIFALAMLPLIGLVGAAVDYSHASLVRADLQAAIDSTALMVSKTATTSTASELQANASGFFNAMFNRKDATGKVAAKFETAGGSSVVIRGDASFDTTFMGIIGFKKIDLWAESTVSWGNTRLRVALVLDVTGSMSNAGKMTALKTASKNLLTQLKSAATTNGDVHVSIIPFAKDVNVNPANKSQPWISWTLWDEVNGSCSKKSSWRDSYDTKTACKAAGGTWTPDSHNTWNGCVTDRDQDYDTKNTAPVAITPGTLFPAEQYSTCPTPLMGLSYDWVALNSKIDALQPNGGTNQAIGLQWGFQSLTAAPFTVPAKDAKYIYKEVIILLSDGLNTQDRWYGTGSSHSPQVDARQKILCDNVKAAGIIMYTVQVNTDGDPTSTLLKNCASGDDKFFLLTSANQMVATFSQIGTALSNLRVAK